MPALRQKNVDEDSDYTLQYRYAKGHLHNIAVNAPFLDTGFHKRGKSRNKDNEEDANE